MAESEFVKVAETSEIPPGRLKLVDVRGERVAVANVGGSFFALANRSSDTLRSQSPALCRSISPITAGIRKR